MNQNVFSVDGKYYDVSVLDLSISGEKIANENSGRLKNLSMYLKYDGIFVNYEVTIGKKKTNEKEYFQLFHKLLFDKENPVHVVKFPYGNKMHEFKAYCSGSTIKIKKFEGQKVYDKYDKITVKFIAIDKAVSPL